MNQAEARRLWDSWRNREFPRGWAGVETNGVNQWPLAYLDTECAACLGRYFGALGFNAGELEDQHRRWLVEMLPDVDLAVAATEGSAAARTYFEDLRNLILFVLESNEQG